MNFKLRNVLLTFLLFTGLANAQDKHPPYQYPKEQKKMETLEEWQDLKFGLFLHWGTYSQWGIVESWSLCPEDRSFTSVRPEGQNYYDYVKEYEKLQTTFNPVNFSPEKWAEAAKYAGMKYMVFTTKHHDGFNMYDTQESDYKITSPKTPFSSHPRADVTKEIFDAFRSKDFMAGAYYSISDWHHNDFWWDYFPPFDRHINYSPEKYPEKWQGFNDFIYNQLDELTSNYGKLGMLWFDLCDVSKDKKVDWARFEKVIKANQPQALMVARHTYTKYENYRTPEQQVPDQALDYPWETCMTMGKSWSYKPGDEYKSVYELVQLLVKIVSRGGNFLLNVGPGPNGDFDPTAYERLKGIGDWMQINSEAIYGTKPISPYHETKLVFTKKKDAVYAFYLPKESETKMPAKIAISSMQPKKGSQVFLLGYKKPLNWNDNGEGFIVEIPTELQRKPRSKHAWVLKFQP
ncbi:alpha-L-fucosidase [Maribacter sp. ANRC-HE7]|uniref:alpha-L-fucosidase n=1 Tax=Maribacter aquimaris TaxID=2737171 RepID=A0ABR7UZ23_9FLAO|nr:alpha-L-fucosidase [Maribacter aquimaris]MBD0777793.1 alpha-L-fucosidase [Maribacter aquimaris]